MKLLRAETKGPLLYKLLESLREEESAQEEERNFRTFLFLRFCSKQNGIWAPRHLYFSVKQPGILKDCQGITMFLVAC